MSEEQIPRDPLAVSHGQKLVLHPTIEHSVSACGDVESRLIGCKAEVVSLACSAPNCPHPALVPDGLCREHAIGRAEDEVRDYERGVNVYNPIDRTIERLDLIKEILSLGLTPADLEPTQENT